MDGSRILESVAGACWCILRAFVALLSFNLANTVANSNNDDVAVISIKQNKKKQKQKTKTDIFPTLGMDLCTLLQTRWLLALMLGGSQSKMKNSC